MTCNKCLNTVLCVCLHSVGPFLFPTIRTMSLISLNSITSRYLRWRAISCEVDTQFLYVSKLTVSFEKLRILSTFTVNIIGNVILITMIWKYSSFLSYNTLTEIHNFPKNNAATSKFKTSYRWHGASFILKAQNSGVTCEPHCYLGHSARCMCWSDLWTTLLSGAFCSVHVLEWPVNHTVI